MKPSRLEIALPSINLPVSVEKNQYVKSFNTKNKNFLLSTAEDYNLDVSGDENKMVQIDLAENGIVMYNKPLKNIDRLPNLFGKYVMDQNFGKLSSFTREGRSLSIEKNKIHYEETGKLDPVMKETLSWRNMEIKPIQSVNIQEMLDEFSNIYSLSSLSKKG